MPAILADNPFAVLSLVAAPAVLTNASSVLALGTSNRFARAIDRARALSAILEKKDTAADPLTLIQIRQLNRVERRALVLLHALRAFYLALGAFAAAVLVSILGAMLASSAHHFLFRVTLWLALGTGTVGVCGLVFGCTLLVAETRLAVQNVGEEAAFIRDKYKDYLTASEKAGEPG